MNVRYVNEHLFIFVYYQHQITNLSNGRGGWGKSDAADKLVFPLVSMSVRLTSVNIKQNIRTQVTEFARPIKCYSQLLISPNHLTGKKKRDQQRSSRSTIEILRARLSFLHESHPQCGKPSNFLVCIYSEFCQQMYTQTSCFRKAPRSTKGNILIFLKEGKLY